MEKPLQRLWTKTLNKGYKVRKNGLDGLQSWQPLKQLYSQLYIPDYEKGIPTKKNFFFMARHKYVPGTDTDQSDSKLKIGEKELDNKIEPHHFVVQHFRIPFMEKYRLSVLKLLQIAYNAGQFKAEVEKNNSIYDSEFVDMYAKYKLDNINTYIDDKFINMVPLKKISGGFNNNLYYEKYLKYKTKYLDLKY